jgi:hypothetical protein
MAGLAVLADILLVAAVVVVLVEMALHLGRAVLVRQDIWRFTHGKDIRNY